MTESVLRILVIGAFILSITILFLVGAKNGWLKILKIGKIGLEMEGEIKRKQSGSLNKLIDDQIHALDREVFDSAVKLINDLYDNYIRYLAILIPHLGARRLVAEPVRLTLNNILLHTDFKIMLRPENLKRFIDMVLREIEVRYEEMTREEKFYVCPIHGGACFVDYPKFEKLLTMASERVIQDFALPLRIYQIQIHEKKIDVYNQIILSYTELEDFVNADTAKDKIEKNQKYIDALSRKPEEGEL